MSSRDRDREKLFPDDAEPDFDSAPRPTPGKRPVTASIPAPPGMAAARFDAAAAWATVLQRATDGGAVRDDAGEAVARASTADGQPLPGELRDRFEASLGADLSGVRIHTGGASAEAATAVGARAYAFGRDIHFGAGQYRPESADGQRLLAHEVAHTVQQAGAPGTAQYKLEVSSPGDAAEVEADRAAEAMIAGEPAQVGSGSPSLARSPDGAAGKDDAGKDKGSGYDPKKPPTWSTKSTKFSLFGRSAELSWKDGAAASITLGEESMPLSKKYDHIWVVPLTVGGGLVIQAAASAKASVSGLASLSAKEIEYGGPILGDPRGLEITAKAKVKLTFTATAEAYVGTYFGASFMHISAGGKLAAKAVLANEWGVDTTFTVNHQGQPGGSFTIPVSFTADLLASGAIEARYYALIDSGTLFSEEIFSTKLASAWMKVAPGYDFGSGQEIQGEPDWGAEFLPDIGPPRNHIKRPMSEKEKDELRGGGGAEGAGAVNPDEPSIEVDCDDPNGGTGGYRSDCPPPREQPQLPPLTDDGLMPPPDPGMDYIESAD